MALPEFNYVAAKTLEEASALVASQGSKCTVMSGGTDVIIQLKENMLKDLETVIDLKTIPDMNALEFIEGEGLKIGANTKLFAIQSSKVVNEKMPAVAQAAHYVASSQIRRKGTMVGNICNASPSADTAPILMAMNAKVKTFSQEGRREIAIDDFFTGLKKTALNKSKGELVTGLFIPELKSGEGSAYFKHAIRKAMDLAIVGVAAWVKMDGKKVVDCRIAMGGVDLTTKRAKEAEKMLIGNEITDELLEKAAVMASTECHPISDVRASAEYRTDMIRVYTKRAINKAIETMKA